LINQSSTCYRDRRDLRVWPDPAIGAQERFATASVRVSNQVIRGLFSQGAKDRIDDCPKHEKKSELSQPSHTNSSMQEDDKGADPPRRIYWNIRDYQKARVAREELPINFGQANPTE
jgi:hypothetical protein